LKRTSPRGGGRRNSRCEKKTGSIRKGAPVKRKREKSKKQRNDRGGKKSLLPRQRKRGENGLPFRKGGRCKKNAKKEHSFEQERDYLPVERSGGKKSKKNQTGGLHSKKKKGNGDDCRIGKGFPKKGPQKPAAKEKKARKVGRGGGPRRKAGGWGEGFTKSLSEDCPR